MHGRVNHSKIIYASATPSVELNTHSGLSGFACQSWIKANERDSEGEHLHRIKCACVVLHQDRQILGLGMLM